MTDALNLDCQNQTASDPYLEQLVAFIRMNAEMERDFGPAGALLRYGEEFEPVANHPKWFTHGAAKQCFDNATRVLISRTTAGDTSVRYAEGYAMDAELPIPMQHAWLMMPTTRSSIPPGATCPTICISGSCSKRSLSSTCSRSRRAPAS